MQMNNEKNWLSQDNQVSPGSQDYELRFPNVQRSNLSRNWRNSK